MGWTSTMRLGSPRMVVDDRPATLTGRSRCRLFRRQPLLTCMSPVDDIRRRVPWLSRTAVSIRRMDLQLTHKRALITGGSRGHRQPVAAPGLEGRTSLLARRCRAAARGGGRTRRAGAVGVVGVAADTGATTLRSSARSSPRPARCWGRRHRHPGQCRGRAGGYAPPPKLAAITGDFFHGQLDIKVMGFSEARPAPCARHAPGRLGPHRQHHGWPRARPATPWAASATWRCPR